MDVSVVSTVDVSGLQRLIPEIIAFGRRTMREQCVTSAAIICINAQKQTPFVTIGRIDSELEVEVTPRTKTGKISKAKRPHHKEVALMSGVRVPVAVLIIMARMDPTSHYSAMTGNRWPLDKSLLPTGKGSAAARAAMILRWVQTMTLSRHSSTHFLQHGWAPAIRTFLSDPDYYAGARKRGLTGQTKLNALNTMSSDDLGQAVISGAGDTLEVMAENAVGGDGNPVLAAKHRAALIQYGTEAAREAIYNEEQVMANKIQEYFDRGMAQTFIDV